MRGTHTRIIVPVTHVRASDVWEADVQGANVLRTDVPGAAKYGSVMHGELIPLVDRGPLVLRCVCECGIFAI